MTNELLRFDAFCENDGRNHHCAHILADGGECYDVVAVDNLITEYKGEIRRLCDEVDALRPDARLGAMLVKKAKEVEALAPGIPRIIVCDAVAAELIERLCGSEEGEEAVR